MANNKMTRVDIIKHLDYTIYPFVNETELSIAALKEFINSQQAEIERLNKILNTDVCFVGMRHGKAQAAKRMLIMRVRAIKSIAIKEYIQRLKTHYPHSQSVCNTIDKVANELIGENNQ